MTNIDELDNILSNLADEAFDEIRDKHTSLKSVNKAKTDILDWIEKEVIGEDDKYINDNGIDDNDTSVRNRLRAEQRAKLRRKS